MAKVAACSGSFNSFGALSIMINTMTPESYTHKNRIIQHPFLAVCLFLLCYTLLKNHNLKHWKWMFKTRNG